MDELKIWYAVGTIKAEMEVESNLPFKIPLLKLKWGTGQVGALPVFASRNEAETYADGAPIILLHALAPVSTELTSSP